MSAALGAVSLGATVLGGLASSSSASQTAKSQSAMYAYQAGIAAQNAEIAKQNENYALMAGEQQAAQSGMKSRYQAGQIKVAQAANGFNINTGTNVDVQEGQQKLAREEQTAIRSSSAKTAYDYAVSAQNYKEQQQLYGMASANTKAAGALTSMASFLGSAASVSDKWMSFNQSGLFNGLNFGAS